MWAQIVLELPLVLVARIVLEPWFNVFYCGGAMIVISPFIQ